MFTGHYAPAFALRHLLADTPPASRGPGLGTAFLAVQLVDLVFFVLAVPGIERWAPDPGLPGLSRFDLPYMPYTHSLAGTLGWAALAALLACVVLRRSAWRVRFRIAAVLAFLVASHWAGDWLVHRQDLALLGDDPPKLGLGLWDAPRLAVPLELALLLAGFALYMRRTAPAPDASQPVRRGWSSGRLAPWVLLAGLLAMQAINWLTPPPEGRYAFSALALLAYLAATVLAAWADRRRIL